MTDKTIHWLTGPRFPTLAELQSTPIASVRLRTGLAAAVMQGSGIGFTTGKSLEGNPDVLVVGKAGGGFPEERLAAWLESMRRVRGAGGKVVLDYTDNLLLGEFQAFYREALGLAHVVVCPSDHMANTVRASLFGTTTVIEDPIEIPIRAPARTVGSPITALWFGHNTNLPYLADFLHRFPRSFTLRVIILCNTQGVADIRRSLPAVPAHLQLEPEIWNIGAMIAAAEQADVCLIPSDPANPRKNGASSNRLITAFALGLPTLADAIASYRAFLDYFADIRSPDLLEILGNPLALTDRVVAAQRDVCPRFQPAVIGRKWRDLLTSLTH